MKHKVGDDIYIPSACYISRGSDDRVGGLARINSIEVNEKLPEDNYNRIFVCVDEIQNTSFNYAYLLEMQDKLKEEFRDNRAYPDPDIDTPWIEEGDTVNGKTYSGPPIW